MHISELAHMLHAFTKFVKSLFSEIHHGILGRMRQTYIHEISANHGARSALAVHAMNDNNVFWVFLQKLKDLFANLEQDRKRWGVFIRPPGDMGESIFTHIFVDLFVFIFAQVENPKLVPMGFPEEFTDFINRIAF